MQCESNGWNRDITTYCQTYCQKRGGEGIPGDGPKAPAGKESNWVPTRGGGQFEVLFRFYAPEKALFDKAWTLPDIERARNP